MPRDEVTVTTKDHKTGQEQTKVLEEDNYIIVCGQRCQITHEQHYPKSGTVQLTIKRGIDPDA